MPWCIAITIFVRFLKFNLWYSIWKEKKKFWTFSKITRVVTLKTFSSRYYKF